LILATSLIPASVLRISTSSKKQLISSGLPSKVGVVAWPQAGMCVVAIGIVGGVGKVVIGAGVVEEDVWKGKIVVEVKAIG
jgi:hypothetical protein